MGRSHECDFPPTVRRLPQVSRPSFPTGGGSRAIDLAVKERLAKALSIYEVDADLLQLGMYGRGNNGAYAQFALYEDNGGVPGTRVAVTGDVLVNLGFTEDAPMPASITLRVGRTYWVGGVFYGGAQLYSNANASAPDVERAALTYGYPFPTTFTPGNPLTDIEFSFYVRVRTVSQ